MYQLIAAIVTPTNTAPVLLPGEFFLETEFVFEIKSPMGECRSWQRAGYVARMFDIPGVGLTEGEVIRLSLERKKITLKPSSEPFRLEFRPHYWVSDYQLQFWANDAVLIPATPLTVGGELFTFGGLVIIF